MYIKCYYNCVFMQSNMWFHKMRSDDIISVLKPDYRLQMVNKHLYLIFIKCSVNAKLLLSMRSIACCCYRCCCAAIDVTQDRLVALALALWLIPFWHTAHGSLWFLFYFSRREEWSKRKENACFHGSAHTERTGWEVRRRVPMVMHLKYPGSEALTVIGVSPSH